MARRTSIAADTPILPHIVADAVVGKVAYYFTTKGAAVTFDTRATADALADRAEEVYTANAAWARTIRARGNAGRDRLYAFMNHWLAGMLKQDHPALFRLLPYGFGWDYRGSLV